MKIKLCNVHKMAVANEGEERKPIFIPFGTWPYDDTISQTLDRPHAEGIAADLDKQIAAGEPGIPVYQGHPDVPEYAGKYPDKGAMGWVKKILVNEDGMECRVEWDRDPGKGFGWFSPYWIGDKPVVGPDGKKNVIVDGLTSIGLVNNPNIREFRLANEIPVTGNGERGTEFKLPEHLVALAKKFDERRAMANVIDANGMGHSDENGQFDGSGSGNGGGGGSSQSARLDRMLGEARNGIAKAKEKVAASKARQSAAGKERAELESRLSEIRKKRTELKDFNDKMEARLKGGGGAKDQLQNPKKGTSPITTEEIIKRGGLFGPSNRGAALDEINSTLRSGRAGATNKKTVSDWMYGSISERQKKWSEKRKEAHKAAVLNGFQYNRATKQYEDHSWGK